MSSSRRTRRPRIRVHLLVAVSLCLLSLSAAISAAAGPPGFTDIASEPDRGLAYERAPTPALVDLVEGFREASLTEALPMSAVGLMPSRPYGIPGVAVFDADRDGDLDLYVTNGPGVANSLFVSRLAETGALSFVDRGEEAGAAATDQDSSGVCVGDLDNDGDDDLVVLGRGEPNRLFENRGDGTFVEVLGSGIEGGNEASVSCALGDVDLDGRLDLVIANSHEQSNSLACFAVPFAENQPNQLFLNRDGLSFEDVSDSSGIREQTGFGEAGFQAGITWATAIVDVDLDGDADVLFGDDQCGFPHGGHGGVDRGFLHVMLNDGTGRFADRPIVDNGIGASGQNRGVGYYMGLAFGDLNCDGALDVFASNVGDFDFPVMGVPYITGDAPTRWFLGAGDGAFSDPGVGALQAAPFAWGNAVLDYDNDGDQDLLALGGLDVNFLLWIDNPGMLLENRGCGVDFTQDSGALSADYSTLNVQGLATGDLDDDGFVDIVTASNWAAPPAPWPLSPAATTGSAFDATAFFVPLFDPTPSGFVYNGNDVSPAGLTVEINHGGDGGWAKLLPFGSFGLTPRGAVNRGGVGAVVSFTPKGGPTVMSPALAGASFASQHSPELHFGLGEARSGTAEVLWPGGVRNRLYGVKNGERLVLPEIPCSFAADWPSLRAYGGCVGRALLDLSAEGVVTPRQRGRLFLSAILAFLDHRSGARSG